MRVANKAGEQPRPTICSWRPSLLGQQSEGAVFLCESMDDIHHEYRIRFHLVFGKPAIHSSTLAVVQDFPEPVLPTMIACR